MMLAQLTSSGREYDTELASNLKSEISEALSKVENSKVDWMDSSDKFNESNEQLNTLQNNFLTLQVAQSKAKDDLDLAKADLMKVIPDDMSKQDFFSKVSEVSAKVTGSLSDPNIAAISQSVIDAQNSVMKAKNDLDQVCCSKSFYLKT